MQKEFSRRGREGGIPSFYPSLQKGHMNLQSLINAFGCLSSFTSSVFLVLSYYYVLVACTGTYITHANNIVHHSRAVVGTGTTLLFKVLKIENR